METKLCEYCQAIIVRKANCPDTQWLSKKFCNARCKRASHNPYLTEGLKTDGKYTKKIIRHR